MSDFDFKDNIWYHQDSSGKWIDFEEWIRIIIKDELNRPQKTKHQCERLEKLINDLDVEVIERDNFNFCPYCGDKL